MHAISEFYWNKLNQNNKAVIGGRYYISTNDRFRFPTFLKRVQVVAKPTKCECSSEQDLVCSHCFNGGVL